MVNNTSGLLLLSWAVVFSWFIYWGERDLERERPMAVLFT